MKRKDLVVGQKYVAYAANEWGANYKSQNYFDEDGWSKPRIFEIVDASEYRPNYYWNRQVSAKEAKAMKWVPRKDNPKKSEDGHEKSRYRNVLAKLVNPGILSTDGDDVLMIIPLNSIRFPVSVWKRRSIAARVQEANREAETALEELKEQSIRRHWLKTEGKRLKNNLKKAARKCGFDITDIDGLEEGLARLSDKPTYDSGWRDEEGDQVLIPYDVFVKLLEAV